MKKYFKSQKEIKADFERLFAFLDKGLEKKALVLLEKTLCYEPYNPEVHYKFAQYFAEKKKINETLAHLAECFDLDESWLEKAKQDPIISKNIKLKDLQSIDEDKLNRWWQVIQLWQIKPLIQYHNVHFEIKPRERHLMQDFYYTLPERVTRYFYEEEGSSFPEFGDHFIKTGKLILRGDSDRNYCGYGKLPRAIKQLSPLLKNVHFFMSSEDRSFLDEIMVQNGQFYFYRHLADSSFIQDKLKVLEKLAHKDSKNLSLKQLLSNEYVSYAEIYIDDMSTQEEEEDTILKVQSYLKKALHYNPKNPEAYYQKARYFEKLDQPKKHRAFLLKTLKCDPHHFFALYDLGILAFEDKDYRTCLNYLRKAAKQKPHYSKIHLLKGLSLEHLGQFKKAEKEYDADVKNMLPHHAYILTEAGHKLLKAEKISSGQFYYQASLKKAKQHEKELKKKLEESKKASPSPDSSIDLFYKNQIESVHKTISAAYLGLSYIEGEVNHDLKAALNYCDKALSYDSKSSDALYSKGTVLMKMGKTEEAEKHLNEVTKFNPENIKALNNKILILFEQKDWLKVEKLSKELLKIDPTYVNGYIALGGAYVGFGQYKKATEIYLKGLNVDPQSEKCYHGLAVAYGWLKDYEKVVEFGDKSLKINPTNHLVLCEIGSALNNMGLYKKALKYLNQCIKLNSQYDHAYYVKACVFALTGKVKEASQMINKTLKLNPSKLSLLQNEPDFKKIIHDPLIQKILFP